VVKRTRDLVTVALCAAMLIGAQLVLSGVAGVEIVTPLLLCFAYSFGPWRGCAIATLFSLLRCFVFGFHINILILYLIYFNAFALFFGWIGKIKISFNRVVLTILIVIFAILFTIFFTLLDVAITSVMYGFQGSGFTTYLIASLTTMGVQLLSVLITVSVLFIPLVEVIKKIK
jgi:hypothetical protein